MAVVNDRQLNISTAGTRTAKLWQQQTIYWSELAERLRTAARGKETLEDYLRLPKRQQDDLKDVGGFVGGSLEGGHRKASAVTGRDLITLDLDNIPAGGTDDVLKRLNSFNCAYVVYSTRKHEPGKPRLRCLFPLDRTATADEYEPIARKLGSIIGMAFMDPTTFEASRLMYWPSCCANSQYVYEFSDNPFLSVDGLLSMYDDWRDVDTWPVVPGTENKHVRLAAKQGNPLEKHGIVGAFCRQYDIYQAIDKFLPGVYEEVEGKADRLTFIEGSTVGGAIVYEDGKFLYSHHATDPVSGRLVNSFDLVRTHKFGDEDDDAEPGTPVNRLPSYSRMSAFALEDDAVAGELSQKRYEQAVQDFGPQEQQEPGQEKVQSKPDTSFIRKLKLHPSTGQPMKTIENILIVLEGDPALTGRIRKDTFAESIVGVAPMPWAPRDQENEPFLWTEDDDSGLALYLEKLLNFQSADKIKHALSQCSAKNRFNPVADFLNSLTWDGKKRLDDLFIDYLGAADTPYVRAVTRKSFVAAVARAMKPGVKYDTMPVLTGTQGLGKTTLIQKLGKDWFTNSVESFEGKDAAELLQGVWIVEIGEMSAYKKSDLDTIKGFLSRTEDQYRAAYARKTEKHPRRCVFFGTSNRSDYLRDPTGGRRFLPIDVGVQRPTKSVFDDLDSEVDQLWAEAVMHWRLGESLFLTGELEQEAKRQQEEHSESDPWEAAINEFVERKVPADWDKKDINARMMYWNSEFGKPEQPVETIQRDRVCAQEIWVECLGNRDLRFMKRRDVAVINDILGRIKGWEKVKNSYRFGPYGRVKGGFIRG
ncbi:VapE domain-containing protein [Sporolactobacillus kofuensis]|uniref:VapE domain-containing protein n=1 Tax=Sporolactobacillus kofuensis TaxID=269672 RepID=A0ABW1WAG5_9BACL|nr:virulence-associated E family protein [Sporolactobacillus kofuensis]MCO7175544.1 virulence-associated E family protein [Sporolactobacillus kofuensis]